MAKERKPHEIDGTGTGPSGRTVPQRASSTGARPAETVELRMTGSTSYKPTETYAWGPGIQPNYVIHYIVSGRGYFETGGKCYPVRAGESFFLVPGTMVHYYPDKEEPWKYVWVGFNGSEVASLLSMTAFFEHPVCPENRMLAGLFEAFSNEVQHTHVRMRNTGLLWTLLAGYVQHYPARLAKPANDYMQLARQYVAANFHRHDFGVSELARAVGLERSYLYRLFVASEGVSPAQYIANMRMEQAVQMLRGGVTQVKLIACSVGYENPLYFSNCFKKKFGVSPKNYRGA